MKNKFKRADICESYFLEGIEEFACMLDINHIGNHKCIPSKGYEINWDEEGNRVEEQWKLI